jgi:hypothetical protein
MQKFTVASGKHKADVAAVNHKTAAMEFTKRLKITESNWSEKISPIVSVSGENDGDGVIYFSTETLLKSKLKVV